MCIGQKIAYFCEWLLNNVHSFSFGELSVHNNNCDNMHRTPDRGLEMQSWASRAEHYWSDIGLPNLLLHICSYTTNAINAFNEVLVPEAAAC